MISIWRLLLVVGIFTSTLGVRFRKGEIKDLTKNDAIKRRQANRQSVVRRMLRPKNLKPRASPVPGFCGTQSVNTPFVLRTDYDTATYIGPSSSAKLAVDKAKGAATAFHLDDDCFLVVQDSNPISEAVVNYQSGAGSWVYTTLATNVDTTQPPYTTPLQCFVQPDTTLSCSATVQAGTFPFEPITFSVFYRSNNVLTIYSESATTTNVRVSVKVEGV